MSAVCDMPGKYPPIQAFIVPSSMPGSAYHYMSVCSGTQDMFPKIHAFVTCLESAPFGFDVCYPDTFFLDGHVLFLLGCPMHK